MENTPLEHTRFAVNTSEIAADVLDGEAVLINLADGMYYSLVGTGSFVWSCIERGQSKEEIAASLVAHYDVAAETARQDLDSLFADLLRENLIVAAPDAKADAENSPELPTARGAYEPPKLKVYSDMQELLALDPPMPDLTDAPWKEPSGAPGAAEISDAKA